MVVLGSQPGHPTCSLMLGRSLFLGFFNGQRITMYIIIYCVYLLYI